MAFDLLVCNVFSFFQSIEELLTFFWIAQQTLERSLNKLVYNIKIRNKIFITLSAVDTDGENDDKG